MPEQDGTNDLVELIKAAIEPEQFQELVRVAQNIGGNPTERVYEAIDRLAMKLAQEGVQEAPEDSLERVKQELKRMEEQEKEKGGRDGI